MPRLSTTGRRPPPEPVPGARSARRALLRRPGPALGALLLALATLLASASAARADVLVSNFDQPASGDAGDAGYIHLDSASEYRGQPFTTGSHAAGYSLESIELVFVDAIGAANIGGLDVSVWTTDADGYPETEQFDLTNPSSIAAAVYTAGDPLTGSFAVFTAPADTTLTASTTYAVVVTGPVPENAGILVTNANGETGEAGWSIADEFTLKFGGGSWGETVTLGSLFIRVNGAEKGGGTPATNNVPTVANEIPDHTATAGTLFIHTFPEDTFTDADTGDMLTYTAVESGETGLPTWLDFNATTRTFSGTPGTSDVETLTVEVTASDGAESVTDSFNIVVSAADASCPSPTGRRQIWTGRLTPGSRASSLGYNGAQLGGIPSYGSLSTPTSFVIGSDTYDILSLWNVTSGTRNLVIRTNPDLSSEHRDLLRLHVCGTNLEFSNAQSSDVSGETVRYWANQNLGWTAGTAVTIYLSLPLTNTPATGAPTVTGFPQVGQTLTAAAGDIADADGLTGVSYGYQWVRVDGMTETNISGATASTYDPVAADVGKTLKVKLTFQDDASNDEARTSAATEAVAAAAAACDTDNTWCATLTVGARYNAGGPMGYCVDGSGLCSTATEYGSLSDTAFTLDGTDYRSRPSGGAPRVVWVVVQAIKASTSPWTATFPPPTAWAT